MIRFECEKCTRALRAPEPLAGKKGRCARCGAANTVPLTSARGGWLRRPEAQPALSVAVKRSMPSSPFRDTADVQIAPAPARFVTAAPAPLGLPEGGESDAPDRPRSSRDFVDRLADQIGDLAGTFSADSLPALDAAPRRRKISIETLHLANLPHAKPSEDSDPALGVDLRGMILGLLAIGAILGFALGLVAAKWLF